MVLIADAEGDQTLLQQPSICPLSSSGETTRRRGRETVDMADGNKIARRSARPFSDEYPKAQSDSTSDASTGSHKKASSDRDDKPQEREMHSRNSSCSNLPPGDLGMELRGLHGATHETAREVTKCLESAKTAKDRVEGRPVNFGTVIPGLYRSGYPEASDHEYLKKLGLKTIVTLVQKDFPEGYQTFIQLNGIKHIVIDMQGTKKVEISDATMLSIMEVVLDQKNFPMLMHCNHGKHRTGCAVAVMRKLMGWSVDSAVQEYCSYADDKVRDNDLQYIRSFDLAILAGLKSHARFDAGVRSSDGRIASESPRFPKLGKFLVITALVLLLWLFTAFCFRTY